jgi:hypothetical protein
MQDNLVDNILNIYRIRPVKIGPKNIGYRNESYPIYLKNQTILNLIIYKKEPDILNRIKAADKVSNYLNNLDFPTRINIYDKILAIKSPNFIKYAAIYNYLPGSTIPWEAYTMEHLKLLGQMMSNIHYCLNKSNLNQNITFNTDVISGHIQLLYSINTYLCDPGVKRALGHKLGLTYHQSIFDQFILFLNKLNLTDNFQILHMDMVRGNILYKKDNNHKLYISGILDFEKTSLGPTMFDIARTLAFLVIDCKYKSEEKIKKYFLTSGYNKRGNAKFNDIQINLNGKYLSALNLLINIFVLHDFYKFLLHNPYESLYLNEHYLRTKDFLIKNDILTSYQMF